MRFVTVVEVASQGSKNSARGSRRGTATATFVVAIAVALAVPASTRAFEPVAVIGASGGGAGRLSVPLGVAVDGAGSVYVSEHVNQRVSQFTTAGAFVRAWGFNVRPGGGKGFEVCTRATGCRPGEAGGHAGQLGFPGGVAVDDNENLYVTDPLNNRVSQFTTEGAFVRAFGFDVVPGGGKGFEICSPVTGCKRGIAGGRAGQLDRPAYVASDGAGGIYVTDEANNRVNQFTTEGAFVRAWGLNVRPGGGKRFELCTTATGCKPGEPGGRAGALRNPDGIATDGAGNLYVADLNFRVSQFTAAGAFVRAWGFNVKPGGGKGFEICTRATGCRVGIAGGGAGQLSLMLGLGADAAGNLYVADSDNSRVSQFTAAGAFTRAFGLAVVPGDGKGFEVCTTATGCRRGARDDRAGGFISTSAVAAAPSGAIYVADAVVNRIQCFGEPGGVPCVRNLFGFGALKRDRRRGTASLAVKVPGPGNLRVRGKLIRTARKRAETAGTVSLPIRPRCRAKRALNREGEVRVRIHVTYRPRSGGPDTRERRVELRKRR
jgi:DNA-binding beta-propeller fold protein YncE